MYSTSDILRTREMRVTEGAFSPITRREGFVWARFPPAWPRAELKLQRAAAGARLGRIRQGDLPIADELDWLCAAADDLLRGHEASSAR